MRKLELTRREAERVVWLLEQAGTPEDLDLAAHVREVTLGQPRVDLTATEVEEREARQRSAILRSGIGSLRHRIMVALGASPLQSLAVDLVVVGGGAFEYVDVYSEIGDEGKREVIARFRVREPAGFQSPAGPWTSAADEAAQRMAKDLDTEAQ